MSSIEIKIGTRVTLLALLMTEASLAAQPDVPVRKQRATAAFKARRYHEACPMFLSVVSEVPSDAWGWNDLALCRIRSGEWEGVLAPLERSSQLAAASGDTKLAAANDVNAKLFASRLLAAPRLDALKAASAAQLARREPSFEGVPVCALVQKARTDAESSLTGDDWTLLAACMVQSKQAPALVARAFLRAAQLGAPLREPPLGGLRNEPVVTSTPGGWKAACVALNGAACGRQWLLCARDARSDPASYTTERAYVVIEAASLSKWGTSPFEAPGVEPITSADRSGDLRCPGDEGLVAHDIDYDIDLAVGFDACTATYVRWRYEDRGCQKVNSAELSEQPFTPVPLPVKSRK